MGRKLSRRSFLRTATFGTAGIVVSSRLQAQPAKLPRKPNLIVFLPDQQRADTISCYGAPHPYAPSLDKLASQSFVFQRAYVAQPVCTPSRSALMTGTWPHANSCLRNNAPLPQTFSCLPEMIGDSDYRCAYMGKWHLGDEVSAQRGFQDWISIVSAREVDSGTNQRRAVPSDYDKFLLARGLKPDRKSVFSKKFASKLSLDLSKPKFLENHVCDFLERHRRDPFVLYVSFWEPHPPYNGPLNEEHPRDQIALDSTADHVFGEDMPLRYRLRQEWARNSGGSREKTLKIKQKYLGLVTEVDRSIGAILSKLEALGLTDDTIIIHTSDHGDMMGAHGLFGKQVLFEEAARVPLLVRLPNQRRNISIAQQVSHIDFVPTVLDLLGKDRHRQCVGNSLAPLLRGESHPEQSVFLQWHPDRERPKRETHLADTEAVQSALAESTRAVISPDGWKLCLRDRDKNELYNLKADPGEKRNLFNSDASREVITRLTGEIHRWQESIGDNVKV